MKHDQHPSNVVSSRIVRPSSFIESETNPANGPTPSEALLTATKRIEAVAYARGFEAALSRLEMLASIVPESVTKGQLVDMLKREVSACIGEWNATQRPNVTDQIPAAQGSANTTATSSRLSASVLFVLGCSWWFIC